MIKDLLSDRVQQLIWDNIESNPSTFVLKYASSGLPLAEIADQIKARQKCRQKLPDILDCNRFLFPSSKAAEQSSSELTAEHKAFLCTGKIAVDLTGGLGIDAIYLSRSFEEVVYVEQDSRLCEYAAHNFNALGAKNISIVNTDAATYLTQLEGEADLIFIDPDRRSNDRRVYSISDCRPDVSLLLPEIRQKCKNWIIKLSPMLDISMGLKMLDQTNYVGLVSTENDLKEVVFAGLEEKNKELFHCIDFVGDKKFTFMFDTPVFEESFGKPGKYLYEPSVTILKLGSFGTLSDKFKIKKLAPNSNLFTSEEICNQFPGRAFRIIDQLSPQRKKISSYLEGKKVRVVSRNFPMTSKEIHLKWKLQSGHDFTVFFTRLQDDRYVALITEEIETARSKTGN